VLIRHLCGGNDEQHRHTRRCDTSMNPLTSMVRKSFFSATCHRGSEK
jgi:hypothetical protein